MSKRDARSNKEKAHQTGKQRAQPARAGTQISPRLTKQERRRERREEQHLQEMQAVRTKRTLRIGFVAVGVVAVVVASYLLFTSLNALNNPSTASSPTATVGTLPVDNPLYPPIDNVYCQKNERGEYHVHALLNVYINGQAVALPENVGIASDSSCLYWLHTHSGNGIVHVEAPQKGTYTVGTFLDIWGEQFSQGNFPAELRQTSGWQLYLNGQPYDGNFRDMTLDEHAIITMAYNSPGITPLSTFNWGDL